MVAPYAVLKRFSRMRGQSIKKLLVLSQRNDPFCAGSPSHCLQARWGKWVYRIAGSPVPVHVRRLHYLATSRPEINRPDGSAYSNCPQVKLCQLMLTPSQCLRYHLPRIPIRRSNPRKARFEQDHGPGATELDALAALHPGTIGQTLGNCLACYCSRKLARQARSEAQRLVKSLSQKIGQRTSGWIPVLGSCTEISRPGPSEAIDSWLYDSARDYLTQLEVYHRYLNLGSGTKGQNCDRPAGDPGRTDATRPLACAS